MLKTTAEVSFRDDAAISAATARKRHPTLVDSSAGISLRRKLPLQHVSRRATLNQVALDLMWSFAQA